MNKEIRKLIGKIGLHGKESKPKYKGVGARNLMDGIAMNDFSVKKANDPMAKTVFWGTKDTEVTEEISLGSDKQGGILVLAGNKNALTFSDNNLLNWFQNRLLINPEEIIGVAVGSFVKGRYKDDEGAFYDEQSLSVEIIGIGTEVLNKVAEDIAKEITLGTVLVKNYEENRMYLVQ